MNLIDKIKMYNEAYRKGEPLVSDSEYDALIEELKNTDPNNDWFSHIEPVSITNSRKRKLPIPMRSLYKVKSISELKKWSSSLGLGDKTEVVVMPKFDGLSLLVNEFTNEAYSRGGEENEGQDCSEHYSTLILTQPQKPLFHYTYGEFMISRKQWEEHFSGKKSPYTGDEYKSPRNTAAGMLNRDTASYEIKNATFFRYGVDEGSIENGQYDYFSDLLCDVCNTYGQEKEYRTILINELCENNLDELFVNWNKKYPIDGIVVYINQLSLWKSIGRHQTTGNPLYAIAYKHPDFTESFETTVKSISWNVAKSGALKPVVNIEAVDTGDCTMENPTGYNAKWINNNGIAPGAKIIVTRSGGVIPKILGTVQQANQDEIKKQWKELETCPICGSPTKFNQTGVELCCTNKFCEGVILAKIVYFYETCSAENMGEETIAKIFNSGFKSVKDMLNIKFDDLIKIEGFGVSVANDILNNNKKIMEGLDMPTLMQASDCFEGIARIKARKILDDLPEHILRRFYERRYIDFEGDFKSLNKTMQSFYAGLGMFYNFLEQTRIPVLTHVKTEINKNGIFSGMNICFSGFRNKELEEKVILGGGKIVSGVTHTTTILVVKDKTATSSKINKAKDLAVVILNLDEFMENLVNCN